MKKIIFTLITLVFILSSCSNPEDLKKIEELEQEISEIKLNEKEFIFEKNKECSIYRDEIENKIDTLNWSNSIITINYNQNRNSCIYYYFNLWDKYNTYYIEDYFTWESLHYWYCEKNNQYNNCNENYQNKLKELTK